MTTDTIEQPSTAVAALDMTALVPTQVYAPGGVEKLIADLEAQARADAKALDISTPKGRKEVASLAYKVARSKTALDDMGKALSADFKAKAAAIDADRRIVRDRLDALRDEVRKPLDEFEAAEAARIKAHEDGIAALSALGMFGVPPDTDIIAARLGEAQAADTGGFQEFTKRAEDAKAGAIAKLEAMLEESRKRDAERAELERLRQEAAERAAREEAERIEREKQEAAARAAENARREAEEKARRDAAEAAEAAERERQRVERERVEAEARAAQAEADKLAAEQRAKEAEEKAERERVASHERALNAIQGMIADACSPFNNSSAIREITRVMDGMAEMKRDWEEFSERAATVIADGRKRIEERLSEVERREEERAEERRKEEALRAQQQAEEAARLERERIEAQQRADEEAARKREADKEHRASVNRAALEAFVAAGLSEGAARTAVEAIAKGNVPNVKISY